MQHYEEIRELIDRVRARWRALCALQAASRGALLAAAILGAAVIAAPWTVGAPVVLMAVAAAAVLAAAGVLTWCLAPLRRVPAAGKVARYIEERTPSLDDRLVTAVEVAQSTSAPALADAMMADAARRSADVDVDAIVPSAALRRAGFQAAAAVIALALVLFAARGPAHQALDAASLTLFPERVTLEVTPGNARIKAGSPLSIQARLVGNRAPVIAQVQFADGDRWRATDMSTDGKAAGAFHLALPSVPTSFRYRIVAGAVTSPAYEVGVAFAPRVTRIDVDYTYPAGLRLEPRTETDSGDIYAPAGTDVRVHVFTDRPAANGQMALGNGTPIALAAAKPNELTATLKVTDDNSYRVALADREGFANPGDTEYFIRTLEDRPPDVRVLKPATDRSVTRLEEVDVEAQAEDDYGIDRLDLVYSVRGQAEKVVPLGIARQSTTVSGRHTLFLEDLNVQPGDFISYYVRARDLTRGTRPNEARSDIFFLEVKPYEQEFALAQSQGGMPGGGQSGIDDLVTAQKEIVVATWKLDRRARSTNGAKSEQDIKSVAKAEAELKTRVEQTSSTFREANMRNPRRGQPQRGRGPQPPPAGPPELKAGQTLPEEDNMTAAAGAMGKAVASLDGLKTADALPPEMEALNYLLKAQADVKRRELMRQQAGSGSGNNRSNYDMSSLFDKELQKAQQTNYETKSSAESRENATQSALDKIKDLARRQDELLKKQQDLARNRAQMTDDELKRELEKLTRDQSELRQKAEELARQMQPQNGKQPSDDSRQAQQGQQGKDGKTGEAGRAGQTGQTGQAGESGQTGQGGQAGQSENSKRMRDVSEEMRNAASELRRQDPGQASQRGSRALEKLREMQQQLESGGPDQRRRALGEMQLEARQLADAQRQIASELGKTAQGDAGKDAVRRLAGEEERLAERARRLQDALKQQSKGAAQVAAGAKGGTSTKADAGAGAKAAGDVARDLEQQRLSERMQQAADAMRAATEDPRNGRGSTAPKTSDDARTQATPAQELARALDKAADKLSSATGARDGESQKLSDQRARAQELRDKLNNTSREIERLAKGEAGRAGGAGRAGQAGQAGQGGQSGSQGQSGQGNAPGSSSQKSAGDSGRSGEGQQGGGGTGTDLERMREQYQRELQETKAFVDQMRREDPGMSRGGGGGVTFEAPSSAGLSAPGTEAFKQDFAKWEEMRRQATQLLETVESSLSKKIQAKQSRDRLAAGADDNAPAGYEKQVDSYFKAIAGKKKP
jgi:hypothetical protein